MDRSTLIFKMQLGAEDNLTASTASNDGEKSVKQHEKS